MFLKGILLTLLVSLVSAENYTINYKAENLLVKEEVPYRISSAINSYSVNASCVGGDSYPDSGYLVLFLDHRYSNVVHRYELDPIGIYKTVELTYPYQIRIESFCPGNISASMVFYYPPPDIKSLAIFFGVLGLGFATMLIASFIKIGFTLQKNTEEVPPV